MSAPLIEGIAFSDHMFIPCRQDVLLLQTAAKLNEEAWFAGSL